jgi:primosomal protein N'
MDGRSREASSQLLTTIQARLPAGDQSYFMVNRRRYQGTLQLIERFAI